MTTNVITIVDYDAGNIGSVRNMLAKVGQESIVSSKPDEIAKANKIILPGVGAFGKAMHRLKDLGIIPALNEAVLNRRVPILGLCLGMQLLSRESEEGGGQGLGWINASTKKFDFSQLAPDKQLPIPHMGWNTVKQMKASPLLKHSKEPCRFYFAHSYHVVCETKNLILLTAHYGYEFVAAVHQANIFGAQFHPEKSHLFGEGFMRSFAEFVNDP